MKNIRCAAALCAVLLFLCAALYGCGGTSENTGTTTPAQPVRETLNSWPQNEYTAALPAPQYGTPDYALIGPADTQYAVFLTDVTRAGRRICGRARSLRLCAHGTNGK